MLQPSLVVHIFWLDMTRILTYRTLFNKWSKIPRGVHTCYYLFQVLRCDLNLTGLKLKHLRKTAKIGISLRMWLMESTTAMSCSRRTAAVARHHCPKTATTAGGGRRPPRVGSKQRNSIPFSIDSSQKSQSKIQWCLDSQDECLELELANRHVALLVKGLGGGEASIVNVWFDS